jgi:hypothetical protein
MVAAILNKVIAIIMSKFLLFLVFFFGWISQAQELNCSVTVNAKSLSNGNLPIFKTLEKSVTNL